MVGVKIAGAGVAVGAFGGSAACAAALLFGTTAGAAVLAAVPVLVWLARLDGWRRLYALTLLLLICSASSQPALVSAAYYTRYVAAALLVLWTVTQRGPRLSRRELPKRTRMLTGGMWCIVVIAALSTGWSIHRSVTVQQSIALALLTALLTGLARARWTSVETLTGDFGVALTVLAGSFAVSLLMGAAGLTGAKAFNGRLQGIYSNPNTLGTLAGLAIPLGVGLWIMSGQRRFLLGTLMGAVALIECQTRTALIGAIVGLVWLAARRRNATKTLLTVAVAVVSVVLLAGVMSIRLPASFTGIAARFNNGGGTGVLNSRTVAWGDALHLWSQRPLEGYGFQTGTGLFADLYAQGRIVFSHTEVHNSYLQALLELGLLGAVPLLLIVFRVALPALTSRAAASPLVGVLMAGLLIQFAESATFGTGQPYPWIWWPVLAALTLGGFDHDLRPARAASVRAGPRREGTGYAGPEVAVHPAGRH